MSTNKSGEYIMGLPILKLLTFGAKTAVNIYQTKKETISKFAIGI